MREALTEALSRLAADLEEADRLELDHDTLGRPGIPDISATILEKIDAASVFVADMTPIVVTSDNKHVPNPNVLIELGYAKKVLGPDRIVLIWNTAIFDTRSEDLPFDLRHRRGPISFSLPTDAPTSEYRAARQSLTRELEQAIRASLIAVPRPAPSAPSWHPSAADDETIWERGSEPLTVNRGSEGATKLLMAGLPRAYARLIPGRWQPRTEALRILAGSTTHPIPLGDYGNLDWGAASAGFIAYRTSDEIERIGTTPSATRWFRTSGELWGLASSFFSDEDGAYYFSSAYAAQRWCLWLEHSVRVCSVVGGAGPFHVKLGLGGIDGVRWPQRRLAWRVGRVEAVESRVDHEFSLADGSKEEIQAQVEVLFQRITEAFGFEPMSSEQFEHLLIRSWD